MTAKMKIKIQILPNEIKPGDVILVNSNSFVGNAIEDFQGNEFHHAGIIVKAYGIYWVVEAVETGVGFTLLTDYLKSYERKEKDLLILRLKEDDFEIKIPEEMLMRFILPKTKTGYDYVNLLIYQPVKFIWKKLTGKEIWIGRKRIKSHIRFICGEWVAYLYNEFYGYFPKWHKVAPVDLYNSEKFDHLIIKHI